VVRIYSAFISTNNIEAGANVVLNNIQAENLEIWLDGTSQLQATELKIGEFQIDLEDSSKAILAGSANSIELFAGDETVAQLHNLDTPGLAYVALDDEAAATLGNVGKLESNCGSRARLSVASFGLGQLDSNCSLKN